MVRVLQTYFAYKAEDADDGLRTRIERFRKDLILCLGKNRFEWTELKDIKRADMNSYAIELMWEHMQRAWEG